MVNKSNSYIWVFIIIFFSYLTYQIYNLFLDINYRLFGSLGFDIASLIFFLLSIVSIVINIVLIIKLYYLKKDSIRWLNIFFTYTILEILIAVVYFMIGLSYLQFTSLNLTDLLLNFSPRVLGILVIIMILWKIAHFYLKKKLK